jgi:hypothetical protein
VAPAAGQVHPAKSSSAERLVHTNGVVVHTCLRPPTNWARIQYQGVERALTDSQRPSCPESPTGCAEPSPASPATRDRSGV